MTRSPLPCVRWVSLILALCAAPSVHAGEEFTLHKFQRQQLTDVYFSEGANAGDLSRDGHADVVYGPYWFQGPDFKTKHEIYPPKPQNREGYADNFFSWIYDFNGDGWNDVFVVGFPGKPGYVYENPKGEAKHWPKHQVFDSVCNESPHFTNLIGDERPELVCTYNGLFGFATVDWKNPLGKWTFHSISKRAAPKPFGHGLGVGDVDGDGKLDIITSSGWFQQPKDNPEETRWTFHEAQLTNAYGGAEMHAYDVDGDGDNDIITSLAAHDYGLAWYEQDRSGPVPVFRQHLIMGTTKNQNRYGVLFTEPHSVALVDMDGDGLKDIVTGRTFYSHHKQSPMWDAGAVVYWFKLARTKDGVVDWIPHQIDGASGIGRQVSIVDVNGDKLPDVVVGGMVGSHVLVQTRQKVGRAPWETAQPKPLAPLLRPQRRGAATVLVKDTGRAADVLEAEDLKVSATVGKTLAQEMNSFPKDHWSGGKQLFWTGAAPGARLELTFDAPKTATYAVDAAFTMARDYGIVQVHLGDAPLGGPIDLYNFPDVISTGMLPLGSRKLDAGPHRLIIEFSGVNVATPKADKIGIDYVRLRAQ